MLRAHVVPSATQNSSEKKVGLACADVELRARVVEQLFRVGVSLVVQSDPETLARTAPQFDVLLIFADGLRTEPLLRALRSLDLLPDRPSLIVVTDKSPPLWNPTADRALVVTLRSWNESGLEWVKASGSATGSDYSGPELPFTD